MTLKNTGLSYELALRCESYFWTRTGYLSERLASKEWHFYREGCRNLRFAPQ